MILIHADRNGWDWFTGKLPQKVVACPDCTGKRPYNEKLAVAFSK